MKIALIGFGNVGQGLVTILRDKADFLKSQENFAPKVVAVATGSHGTLYHPNGLDLNGLLSASEAGGLSHYPDEDGLIRDWSSARIVAESNANVMVGASPSNLETGQPMLDLCYQAFDAGKHVVLANKGAIAVAYHELLARAQTANKQLRFEATVMAGTPSIQLAQKSLAGCTIQAVKGILNGTTNYILTQMETGMSYTDALAQAQDLGYAETDPRGDVEGWDVAGKAVILANVLFGATLTINDLSVQGITDITLDDIQTAQANNQRWKLIATVTPEGGRVQPICLPMSDPLAGVGGATNAITLSTDLMGDVTLIGAGAGRIETGFAILADLLDIARYGYTISG